MLSKRVVCDRLALVEQLSDELTVVGETARCPLEDLISIWRLEKATS